MKKVIDNTPIIEEDDYMPEPSEIVMEDAAAVVEHGEPGTYNRTDDGKYVKEEDVAPQISTRFLQLYKNDAEQERVEYLHRFYTIEDKYNKAGEYTGYKLDLDNYAIIDVLRELGYCRYDQPNGSFEYVHIKNNVITLLKDSQVIVDAFEDYVKKLPTRYIKVSGAPVEVRVDVEDDCKVRYVKPAHIEITSEMLLRKIYKNIMYYFTSTLPRLRPTDPIRLLQDTKHSKYVFYNNGVVRIDLEKITFFRYDELELINEMYNEDNGSYIWSNNILDRDFPEEYIDMQGNALHQGESDFEIFVNCICGIGKGLLDDGRTRSTDYVAPSNMPDGSVKIPFMRKQAIMNIFGYLMHNNYECNLRSVMFIDMNKENMGKPAGGTGKGIIGKALSQMMNRSESDSKYIAPPGKNFDPEDERRYSDGDITTQLIHIEDIKKEFKFESFFNDVTDGAVFRKMYQDKTKHRVKIMLSSNQAIDLSAPSCKRRMVVFELDNFFNENKTPQDIFGKRFFESQWNKKDWAMFDVFMLKCCYQYMKEKDTVGSDGKVIGLRQPPLLNYTNMLLYSKLSDDFIKWFEDKISEATKYMIEKCYSKNALYTEFSDKYTEFKNEGRYKRAFTAWCKFYLQTLQIPSAEKRSTEDLLILYPKPDVKITYIYK